MKADAQPHEERVCRRQADTQTQTVYVRWYHVCKVS